MKSVLSGVLFLIVGLGFSQSDYEKAKTLFNDYFSKEGGEKKDYYEEEIVRIAPASEFGMFVRAWWLYEDSLCKDALFISDSIISHYPGFGPAYYAQGCFLNNCKQDYENAKYYFEKCIELKPDFYGAYRNLGITWFNMDDYEKAGDYFKKAINLNPNDTICLQYYGASLFLTGNTVEAYKILKSIKDESVYLSDYYYYRGWCELELEQYPDALITFSQGVAEDPKDAGMLCGHGWAQMYMGNDKDAIYDFEQSLILDSTSAEAWLGLGTVSYYLREYDKSISEMNKVIEMEPENGEAWFYKGSALYEKGLYKEAIDAFTEAIMVDEKDAYSYFFRGSCYYMINIDEYADLIEKDFEKAISLENADEDTYYNMAIMLFDKMGLSDLAIKALTLAIETEPSLAEAYHLRGIIYDSLGETDKACAEWTKASELGYKKAVKDVNKYCK